ncbi:MAG: ABC transporter substrate-binding protein [Spirochaetaceae bacterium]|jgi:iron complex transport system substrate-binding protein|nr:ABC transporter substrate-binding protein [Spirochaetaceae bacterium]
MNLQKRHLLLAALAWILVFSGCRRDDPARTGTGVPPGTPGAPGAPGTAGEAAVDAGGGDLYWKVIQDGAGEYLSDREGNRIPLKTYRRIIVISPGAVETLYLIGGEGAVAAVSSGRDPIWPEEKTKLLPTIGNVARPNLEAAVALEPDLVIGNAMSAAFIAELSGRAYPALIHGADSIADIFNSTILLGRLTGREAEAQKLVAEKQTQLETLAAELRDRPLNLKGAFLYSANPIMAFTEKSLAGEILTILGVDNIAAGFNAAQPILSSEYILARDPDFLFGAMMITEPSDILAADSVIAKTRAGRENNLAVIPSSLFLRPSPRIVESLLELQKKIKKYAED